MIPSRIATLTSYLDPCDTFADIGCDHALCTKYMLDNGLCRKAIATDISDKCLQKARDLLAEYALQGRCEFICTDGLDGVPEADEVLVAGMGGEEMARILERRMPPKFILQPMRNFAKVREALISHGACILQDTVFKADGYYYVLLKGACTGAHEGPAEEYTPLELEYGKGYGSPEVREFLSYELEKKQRYAQGIEAPREQDRIWKDIQLLKEALGYAS
ncbi:MAG: class I SAM-dependent methyltransferase [Clostridia bacterium]|nr:class I SAM-dependent methyltransferase [Clostridia bacterium]